MRYYMRFVEKLWRCNHFLSWEESETFGWCCHDSLLWGGGKRSTPTRYKLVYERGFLEKRSKVWQHATRTELIITHKEGKNEHENTVVHCKKWIKRDCMSRVKQGECLLRVWSRHKSAKERMCEFASLYIDKVRGNVTMRRAASLWHKPLKTRI